MTHEDELSQVQERDRLFLAAQASGNPDDWAAYDAQRRIVAARLGLDSPGAAPADDLRAA